MSLKGQASTIAILFLTLMIMATILLMGHILIIRAANTIASFKESMEQGLRSKENIAIYIYRGPNNETSIMIKSLWSGETIISHIVAKQEEKVLRKDITVVVPARGEILLKPSDLIEQLAIYDNDYDGFRRSVQGLIFYTSLRNSFQSGWGKQ